MTDRDAELAALYQEIQDKQARVVELLREAGPEEVQDYTLHGAGGAPVRLSELFGDRDELIVVHNMGRGCPYCTLWADGFNGVLQHLESRAAFVVVSPDRPEDQLEFANARGWRFRMASAGGTTFSKDLGFETEHEGKPFALPGCSMLKKREDGGIERTARASFGPGDPFCSVFHLFPLLDRGYADWAPRLAY